MKLLDCGHVESLHDAMTTGYGRDKNNKTHCYDCCLKNDIETLVKTGKTCGYLDSEGKQVTTWPGLVIANVHTLRSVNHGFCGRLIFWSGHTLAGKSVYGISPGMGMYTSIKLYKQKEVKKL